MKIVSFAIALLFSATAWGAEPCAAEMKAYERAVKRGATARQDLANYENDPLAPLTPGQAAKRAKQLQQYKDNLAAAVEDLKRTSDAKDRCLRKSCKKWNQGWQCVVAGTYENCCLDKGKKP